MNARANTCTQSSDTDAEVYWINGAKVADNYADLYDGSWDSTADRLDSGNEHTGTFGDAFISTGTNSNGTTDTDGYLGNDAPGVTTQDVSVGRSDTAGSQLHSETFQQSRSSNRRVYGLSQVFVVRAPAPSTTDISIVSSPAIGDTYRLGETVEVEVTYSEAVTVRGTPLVGLSVKNAAETDDIEYEAAYVRGSGTTKLVFALTVPSGLKDDNGIQLHSDPLRLNGATIVAVSDGLPAVWNPGRRTEHRRQGRLFARPVRRHLRPHAPGARRHRGGGDGGVRLFAGRGGDEQQPEPPAEIDRVRLERPIPGDDASGRPRHRPDPGVGG